MQGNALLACVILLSGGEGLHYRGSASRRGLHPGGYAHREGVEKTPPRYGQQAGITHPTGIYSCFELLVEESFPCVQLFFDTCFHKQQN